MPVCRLVCTIGICLGFSLAVLPGRGRAADQEAHERAVLRDFNAAAALQNTGLYQRAGEKWTGFISQNPNDARLDRAYYYLGICQLHSKKYAAAIATFQTLSTKYPAFPDGEGVQYSLGMARYQAALESKNREDFKSAAETLAATAAKYPQGKHTAAALYYQGESLLSAGDPTAAAQAYQKLIASFPTSPLVADAYYALGTTQQEAGRDSEAIDTFQKFLGTTALAGHELATEIRLRLGLSLLKEKKYSEAEPHFAAVAAVANFPNADLALFRQGQCRLQAGKAVEAAALLADLAKKFPNSRYKAEAQLAAGKCWFSAGKFSEAQGILEPLAKTSARESAEAALWLSRALLKSAKPQDALTVAEGALKTNPAGDTAALLELARADALVELSGRRNEALAVYEKFAAQHPEHPLAAQSLYMAASMAFDAKDYAAARRHAAALLANARWAGNPLLPAVLCIAAESHLAPGGDAAQAEQYYRQVADRFAKTSYSVQANFKLGEIATRQKKYDDAVKRYKQCLAEAPDGVFAVRAKYGLAAASFAKQDFSGASEAIGQILAGSPEPAVAARARYLRGLIFQRQKQLDSAAADLETFLNGQPSADEAADARYALALCRIGQKQFDQAAVILATLVQQKPDYPSADRAYYELGHASLQENRSDGATAAFRTLAEKFPASPLAAEACFHVGRAHEAKADRAATPAEKTAEIAQAADAFAAGLAKAKDAELREKLDYKLADMRFRQKQFEQAATILQSELREYPGGSLAGPAQFLAAECLFAQNKFDVALPLFIKVADAKVEKYQAQSLYRAGTCELNLKKWPEGQKCFEALARDFPRFDQLQDARYGLAVALQNQGKLAEARGIYQEVVKATEGEAAAKARFMLGEIAFGERKYEEAIEHYVMVTAGYPYPNWQALAQFEIGRCFLSLGKRQKAVDAFRTVVDKYPEHAKAQDAARMLAELK